MHENDLQFCVDHLMNEQLPFALWSLPDSSAWKGIAQNNRNIDLYNEEIIDGFVVAKFNDEGQYRFIRNDINIENVDISTTSGKELKENDVSTYMPEVISKEDYIDRCSSIIESIKAGSAEKVVFSRVKKADTTKGHSQLFLDLVKSYPQAMVYLYHIDGEVWLGASPETLLKVEGGKFFTMALAGSKSSDDPSDWADKEIEEQAYVEEYIKKQLNDLHLNYDQSASSTIKAGPVKHIITHFSGDIKKDGAIELLNKLHPTPAVCGIPVDVAKKIINERESHRRLDYTGFIGPVSEEKKCLFVNLRSALLKKDSMYLFLGGGITKDSIPEDEWKETELKAKTLLSIL